MLSRFSHVQLFTTQWTVTNQAPLSMEFSRQGYWSGLPCPPARDLHYDPAISLLESTHLKRYMHIYIHILASQVALVVKNPPANAEDVRDMGSIPGLGRSPGGGHGNLLQYSCLENPMDRGAWRATVHGVAKSQIRLSD